MATTQVLALSSGIVLSNFTHGHYGAQAVCFSPTALLTGDHLGISFRHPQSGAERLFINVAAQQIAHHPAESQWLAAHGAAPIVVVGTDGAQAPRALDSAWVQEGGYVTCLAYSPGGTFFALGFNSGQVGLYDAKTCREMRRLNSPSRKRYFSPMDLAFDAEECRLWVAYEDWTFRQWSVANGTVELQSLRHELDTSAWSNAFHVMRLAAHPHGKWLAAGVGHPTSGGSLTLYDITRPTGPE